MSDISASGAGLDEQLLSFCQIQSAYKSGAYTSSRLSCKIETCPFLVANFGTVGSRVKWLEFGLFTLIRIGSIGSTAWTSPASVSKSFHCFGISFGI